LIPLKVFHIYFENNSHIIHINICHYHSSHYSRFFIFTVTFTQTIITFKIFHIYYKNNSHNRKCNNHNNNNNIHINIYHLSHSSFFIFTTRTAVILRCNIHTIIYITQDISLFTLRTTVILRCNIHINIYHIQDFSYLHWEQ
jgi:hypothetical protein